MTRRVFDGDTYPCRTVVGRIVAGRGRLLRLLLEDLHINVSSDDEGNYLQVDAFKELLKEGEAIVVVGETKPFPKCLLIEIGVLPEVKIKQQPALLNRRNRNEVSRRMKAVMANGHVEALR